MQFLLDSLLERKVEGNLRQLSLEKETIDFSSNDYLGFARNEMLQHEVLLALQQKTSLLAGSTGSRLLTGNSEYVSFLEQKIANLHAVESALLFSSGYTANLSLFSSIPKKNDTIIVDELIHASIHDGCSMSYAQKWKFKHNDIVDLESKLKKAKGNVFVAIESVYSMDGTIALLTEIACLCEKYKAYLIVDEAHAFGVFGLGMVHGLGLQSKVFSVLITYGKALGAHGAAILGNKYLKEYLVNFARPFIYTTAVSNVQWLTVDKGYDFLLASNKESAVLKKNIHFFNETFSDIPLGNESPVKAIFIPQNFKVKAICEELKIKGFSVFPILSPTVAKGKERIRICLHSYNNIEEIKNLHTALYALKQKHQ